MKMGARRERKPKKGKGTKLTLSPAVTVNILPALPLPINKTMVHKEDGVAGRRGQQPHSGAKALMGGGVDGLLDAAPVLCVLGLRTAVAEVQRRYRRFRRRLFVLAAGETRRTTGADEDRGVGECL